MRKTVMITGSTGMLGNSIIRTFLTDKRYTVIGIGRSLTNLLPTRDQIQTDFSQPLSLRSIEVKADVIIHTAALTDLNLCEADRQLALTVNADSAGEIARKTKPGGFFFYISTDSVFDGRKGNYSESDLPNPINNYAETKLKGEQASRAIFPETIVIRTNIYGFHDELRNSLAEWAYKEWKKGKKISGFKDLIFNALYTKQLAEVIKSMTDNKIFYPVLNVASGDVLSKHDFLDFFRKKLGVQETLLSEASSDQFPSSVKRPINTSLDISLLKTFHRAPSIDEGLDLWVRDVKETRRQTMID